MLHSALCSARMWSSFNIYIYSTFMWKPDNKGLKFDGIPVVQDGTVAAFVQTGLSRSETECKNRWGGHTQTITAGAGGHSEAACGRKRCAGHKASDAL